MLPVHVNGRWTLMLPDHRAERPEWPWYEAARFAAMHHHLAGTGGLVYDIGTEEGDHAAVFASWGCDVVLAEPNPKAWPCTRAVFEANCLVDRIAGWWWGYIAAEDGWEPSTLARFGRDGWPAAAAGRIDRNHGMAHLSGRADPHVTAPQPSITLDRLVTLVGRAPTAITVDVEGAELLVLRGAETTLADIRPLVFVSIHPEYMVAEYDSRPFDLHDLMASHGYEGVHLATDHEEHWMFRP